MAASTLDTQSIEKIIELKKSGLSHKETSESMKNEYGVTISPTGVQYHWDRSRKGKALGTKHKLNKYNIKEICERYQDTDNPITLKELADSYGVTVMAIKYHLKKNNVPVVSVYRRREKNPVCKYCGKNSKQEEFYRVSDNKCKKCAKVYNTAISHGIDVKELFKLFNGFDGYCQCCGEEVDKKELNLDHDHSTGES